MLHVVKVQYCSQIVVKSVTFELYYLEQLPMSSMSEHITCMDTVNY